MLKTYYAGTAKPFAYRITLQICKFVTQQTELPKTKRLTNSFFQPTVLLKSTTTSLLGAKDIRFSFLRRDNETFTCRFASVQSDYKQRDFPRKNNRNYNISVQMISQTNLKTKTPFTVSLFWLSKQLQREIIFRRYKTFMLSYFYRRLIFRIISLQHRSRASS